MIRQLTNIHLIIKLLRFQNKLDPAFKKTPWTKDEKDVFFEKHQKLGNKWSEISSYLPGRYLRYNFSYCYFLDL